MDGQTSSSPLRGALALRPNRAGRGGRHTHGRKAGRKEGRSDAAVAIRHLGLKQASLVLGTEAILPAAQETPFEPGYLRSLATPTLGFSLVCGRCVAVAEYVRVQTRDLSPKRSPCPDKGLTWPFSCIPTTITQQSPYTGDESVVGVTITQQSPQTITSGRRESGRVIAQTMI